MVTLKDVAREAGVSMMTVSRVINGNTSKVSASTAERIQKLAKKMGYVPNSSARTLAARSSKLIALLLLDDGVNNPLEDPYNAAFLGEITRHIQNQGYFLILRYIKDYKDITFSLRSWNAEGAIFIGMFDDTIRDIQNDNQIPLIFTDSYSKVRQITNIGIDDYKGGRLAAEYMIKRGHTSLAFVSPLLHTDGVIAQRYYGFRDGLSQAGLTLPPRHILTHESPSDDPTLIDRICNIKDEITGIFTTADQIAFFLMEGLKTRGLNIPEDLSIIGFDDFPISSKIAPALTTIHQNIKKKAGLTCDLLFRHIENTDAPSENITLDVELMERSSVKRILK